MDDQFYALLNLLTKQKVIQQATCLETLSMSTWCNGKRAHTTLPYPPCSPLSQNQECFALTISLSLPKQLPATFQIIFC